MENTSLKYSSMIQSLKDGAYGDQSISADKAAEYIIKSFKSFVLDPNENKMDVNTFIANMQVISNEDDLSFNTDLAFPSTSYISSTYDYNYTNKQNINITWPTTWAENFRKDHEGENPAPTNPYEDDSVYAKYGQTFNIIMVTDADGTGACKHLFKLDITSANYSHSYYIETELPLVQDGEDRVKTLKITPIKYTNSKSIGFTSDKYIAASTLPQFVDSSEDDTANIIDLYVRIPATLGEKYNVSLTLLDHNVYGDVTLHMMGNELGPDVDDEDQDEDVTELIIHTTNEPDSDAVFTDYTTIAPQFSTFIMPSREVDKMMYYIVSMSNWIGDEADIGNQQSTALGKFNPNIVAYYNDFYALLPSELKKGVNEIKRNMFNSKVATVRRRF